jgi:2-keto-4-pentenoate hydratase/2-oxohepta-3-ene-1,7-dioic acid hydratase in catechol pathway
MAKITRYFTTEGAKYGLVEDGVVYELVGQDPFAATLEKGNPMGEFEHLLIAPPCQPSKIIAVGRNYAAHAAEMGNTAPEDEPFIFLKPTSALIGYDIPIQLPDVGRIDLEGELAVVMGKVARHVSVAAAQDTILGYTCANDVSARVLQKQDAQWWRAKGFDTFCPLGPWIETNLTTPGDLRLQTHLSGKTVQDSRTSLMIHNIPSLIAFVSRVMTLLPGDVILTGTPEGVSELNDDDVVEVEIEGIGTLRNPVERL